jgi:hypothetical protein
MALVPPPATAIMLKKKGIYGHPEEGLEARKPFTPSYDISRGKLWRWTNVSGVPFHPE